MEDKYTYQYWSKFDNTWQPTPLSASVYQVIKNHCRRSWMTYRILLNDEVIETVLKDNDVKV